MVKEFSFAPLEAKLSLKGKADQVSNTTIVSVSVYLRVASTGHIMIQTTAPSAARKARTIPVPKTAATPKISKATTPEASLKGSNTQG